MNANKEMKMQKSLHTTTKQRKMDSIYRTSKRSVIFWILLPATLKEIEIMDVTLVLKKQNLVLLS